MLLKYNRAYADGTIPAMSQLTSRSRTNWLAVSAAVSSDRRSRVMVSDMNEEKVPVRVVEWNVESRYHIDYTFVRPADAIQHAPVGKHED